MKYIFVAGAPGSKWSSVVKNIYYSPDIDRSDYKDERTYYHDASGEMQLMHLGAYFDPGMTCNLPEYFNSTSRHQAEQIFNYPFEEQYTDKYRIIKSHVFSYKENIDYLRNTFPESPIILVRRPNDACLGWWVKCGHFNITYPLYHSYYKDLKTMSKIIEKQNQGIGEVIKEYPVQIVDNNRALASILKLDLPPEEYKQNYLENDIEVKVIL